MTRICKVKSTGEPGQEDKTDKLQEQEPYILHMTPRPTDTARPQLVCGAQPLKDGEQQLARTRLPHGHLLDTVDLRAAATLPPQPLPEHDVLDQIELRAAHTKLRRGTFAASLLRSKAAEAKVQYLCCRAPTALVSGFHRQLYAKFRAGQDNGTMDHTEASIGFPQP